MALSLMSLTAIGSYGFLTRASPHGKRSIVTPHRAGRIVLAKADMRDLHGIARLDATVRAPLRAATPRPRLVDDQAKSRADLAPWRHQSTGTLLLDRWRGHRHR
jgi:hypothetical protein